MTDHSSAVKDLASHLQHQFRLLDAALQKVDLEKSSQGELGLDAATLSRLIENADMSSAVFPVYGAMKAGKSTFLACLIGEKVLPEQAAPMTSIPIRIKHVQGAVGKRLFIPHHEKWNNCIAGFTQLLLSGSLINELSDPNDEDVSTNLPGSMSAGLYRIQEDIRSRRVTFLAEVAGDSLRETADALSHFVRLLWLNEIDFESDYNISLALDALPTIEISMAVFESYGKKSFSLLDTPGPNEARASQALIKLGPQVMKYSSGCILCVMWQHIDSSESGVIFSYVNQSMKGKKVIVIVTQMDSYTDSDPKNLIVLRKNLESYFNNDMNITIHLTSGHKMFTMMKLEKLLLEHKSSGSDEGTILAAVDKSVIASNLHNPTTQGGYLARSLWTLENFNNFVEQAREELKSDEVLESFRELYHDSERLAITAHVATLEGVHSRWLQSFNILEDFVTSSGAQRAEIQQKLQDTGEIYRAVVAEMNQMPNKIKVAVDEFMEEKVGKGLNEFALTMSGWRVVKILDNNVMEEGEEIDLPGGRAHVMQWLRSSVCEGKLISYMKPPTRKCLTAAKSELPTAILKQYEQCSKLVEKVVVLDTTGSMGDMNIYLREAPAVSFDVEKYVEKVCKMDGSKISFRQEGDKCVIVNEIFKEEVLQLFKASFNDAIALIATTLHADLSYIFADFAKLVQSELESVQTRYERNQEFLNRQLEAADLQRALSDSEEQNDIFTAKLAELKVNLSK